MAPGYIARILGYIAMQIQIKQKLSEKQDFLGKLGYTAN